MTWTQANLALWALLGVVWLGGALMSRRTVQREPPGARLRYLAIVMSGTLLLFSHAFAKALPWLEHPLWPASPLAGALGLAGTAAGVGFAIWARLHLGRLWSGTITLKEGHRLIQSGPYALTRHPIYTGLLLAGLGTAITHGTVRGSLGLLLWCLGFRIKLGIEERLMASQFGDEHRLYRQRVRMLIPFIY